MQLLKQHIHEDVKEHLDLKGFKRIAARGIIMDAEEILLIYTKRYNDYSFPGGGLDSNELIEEGLLRELNEETGAQNIKILDLFGLYEEYRPTHYDDYDYMHMISHFYFCEADKELGEANPEDYEIKNGSVPVWVNINEAIKHNENVIKQKETSMGLSIERETYVLKQVKDYLKIK